MKWINEDLRGKLAKAIGSSTIENVKKKWKFIYFLIRIHILKLMKLIS